MAWQSVGQLGSTSGDSVLTPSSRTSAWAGAAATRAPAQAKAVAIRRIQNMETRGIDPGCASVRRGFRVPSPSPERLGSACGCLRAVRPRGPGSGRGRGRRHGSGRDAGGGCGLRAQVPSARAGRPGRCVGRGGPGPEPPADTPMSHPQDLSLREQAAAVEAGDLDPRDLLQATLERIQERDPALNSIIATFAADSERMLAEAPPGPLHGVPIAVKDMFQLPWRGPRDGAPREALPPGESGIYRALRGA